MSDDGKTAAQLRRMRRVAPDLAARMEAESRTWMVRCSYCGYERSVWDLGGIRYKASGTSRQLRRCPHCGRLNWHFVYRSVAPSGAVTTPPPLADAGRRRLRWALGVGGLLLVLVAFVGGLFLLLNALLQPVVNRGDAFMQALQSGDYAGAYALCAPALQQQLGDVAGLTRLAQGHQPGTWNWTNRSIRNGSGRLDGTLTYADGTPGTVQLTLQQVADAWRIAGFQMVPR